MDPYLEDPASWPTVHRQIISEIQADLNSRLHPRYFVTMEERVYNSDAGEIHEPSLRVIEHASQQVITVIELLSPMNKSKGSPGRKVYMAARSEILASDTNWVEIDLLRLGDPVIPREIYPKCEYTVHISRVTQRPKSVVMPLRIHERLPVIPIPLSGKQSDTEIDLQEIVAGIYEQGGFERRFDYSKEPQPPLSHELAKWANKHLLLRKA
jgi:hypothetical protein